MSLSNINDLAFSGLLVHVDKRITLAAFKQNLEPFVGVTSTQFKVFRVYANNQEFESVRLNETLSSFSDDNKVLFLLLFWYVRLRMCS